MGVASDGSYDIPEGLNFSFPVTCQGGGWHIVQVGPITLLLSVCFYHILVGVPTSSWSGLACANCHLAASRAAIINESLWMAALMGL